ncbi:hypothetical protein Tco_1314709 [Tanacetum coccineum]
MHTHASISELVEPLPEPERTLNRRLRQRNRRVPYDQRSNPSQHPRIVYPPVLNINYFHHFLDILRNYDPIDDEPMYAADHVIAPTPGSVITILETANEFAIKGTNISKITRKQSKTSKHEHGKRKSTKEAKDSEAKPIKVNSQSTLVNLSQLWAKKS